MLNFFFFNDTATTEIYTLSLHDALPIHASERSRQAPPPADMTESWSGVAPSSRRRIRPMNGVVRLAKTANRSAAETSMRSARRISGLKGGGLISPLCRILGGVTTHPSAPPDLTGQVALVTGPGRGIGQAS